MFFLMSPLAEMINELLLKGSPRPVVEAAITAKLGAEPLPTEQEVDRAYSECVESWVRTVETGDPDKIYAFHIQSRQLLYREAFQDRDFRACLAILKDLAKLEKSYEYQRKRIQNTEEESEEGHYLRLIHGKNSADNGPTREATGKGRRRQSTRANS